MCGRSSAAASVVHGYGLRVRSGVAVPGAERRRCGSGGVRVAEVAGLAICAGAATEGGAGAGAAGAAIDSQTPELTWGSVSARGRPVCAYGCGGYEFTDGSEPCCADAWECSWVGDVRARRDDVARGPRLCGNCSGRGREWVRSKRPHLLQSTFPGLRLERRQVEVSVVQQLKHRRRTRSESLVVASSVKTGV